MIIIFLGLKKDLLEIIIIDSNQRCVTGAACFVAARIYLAWFLRWLSGIHPMRLLYLLRTYYITTAPSTAQLNRGLLDEISLYVITNLRAGPEWGKTNLVSSTVFFIIWWMCVTRRLPSVNGPDNCPQSLVALIVVHRVCVRLCVNCLRVATLRSNGVSISFSSLLYESGVHHERVLPVTYS